MDAYVNPVAQAAEYQRLLLSLLGDDDPAEVQSATPAKVRALIADAGELLGRRPEPREWSIFECVAHIVNAEIVCSGRYRWIIAHDAPDIPGYDQDLWVNRLHTPAAETPEQLLAVFEPLRAANIDLWRRSSAEERARFGLHRERGPEGLDLTFRLMCGHDRFHFAQAERALKQLRRAG